VKYLSPLFVLHLHVHLRPIFETQNFFESRIRPGDPVVSRIHGTPGYPIGLTIGLTFRPAGK
jgi:hypothetical protein